jgi:phage/plasmid-associated DNA primase
MYGTESIIKNNCKLIVPSNWLPNFETDEGMKSRLKCMQFNSKFKQNTTIDNYEELDFVRDCNLMDKIVDCKYEVISLLREYVFSYINNNLPTMPSEFQETTNTTYELNDEFNAWIEDNCVMDSSFKLAKQDILKYSDFDKKDLFSNMKRLRFKYHKIWCIDTKRGVYIGLKKKEDDCEME